MTESPRSLFQQVHKEAAADLSNVAQGRTLRLAAVFAMAELTTENASKENLDGARRFSQILMTLGDPIEKPAPYPDKQLKHL